MSGRKEVDVISYSLHFSFSLFIFPVGKSRNWVKTDEAGLMWTK
jgi:hypothetical protein